MEYIKYVIEHEGKVTLNNEYTIEIKKNRPLIIDWFAGNDLTVNGETYNTDNIYVGENKCIKIDEKAFIIRPQLEREKNLKCLRAETHFVFPKKHTVELCEEFLIIDKVAIDLCAKVEEAKIETSGNKIILKDKRILLIYNPQSAVVEHHIVADEIKYSSDNIVTVENLKTVMGHVRITKFEIHDGGRITFIESYVATKGENTGVQAHEIPFAFLQCVKYKDFANARKMLGFEISDAHLAEYFGEFELLLNNYLGNPNLISLQTSKGIRNFHFQIDNGLIVNII